MNALHPTETLTLDNLNINWELINLNPEKIELLNYLEKETKISKESYITDLLNGDSDWIDYQDIKYLIERKKSTNLKFHSGEEGLNFLRNLYLNKQNHLGDSQI